MLLRLKKTWLILACLIALGIYLNEIRLCLPHSSTDQWLEHEAVNQTTLTVNDLEALPEDVDAITFQLIRNAIDGF